MNNNFLVLKEHYEKIISSSFDAQTAFAILNLFIPYKREERFVPVHSKVLEGITYKYKKYIDFFIDEHLIFSDNYYNVKLKICRKYALRESSKNSFILIPITSPKFIQRQHSTNRKNTRLMKLLSKQETFRLMKEQFLKFLDGLNIDAMLEHTLLEDSPGQRLRLARDIYNIKFRNIYFKRNTTNNRLDTNLTNLWKDHKFFHSSDDYVMVDIKNSQPFLLSYYTYYVLSTIEEYNNEEATASYTHNLREMVFNYYDTQKVTDAKTEILGFLKLCQNGTLYEEISSHYSLDRESMKKLLMKILYSKNSQHKILKIKFTELFPFLSEIIAKYKELYGYKTFAIDLQKLESELVLDTSCRLLTTNGIVPITIHDSWILPLERFDEAMEIIKSSFPIEPRFSVEYFADKKKALGIN
jgi:hypothetical protein